MVRSTKWLGQVRLEFYFNSKEKIPRYKYKLQVSKYNINIIYNIYNEEL